jgi:hypothetical protein
MSQINQQTAQLAQLEQLMQQTDAEIVALQQQS